MAAPVPPSRASWEAQVRLTRHNNAAAREGCGVSRGFLCFPGGTAAPPDAGIAGPPPRGYRRRMEAFTGAAEGAARIASGDLTAAGFTAACADRIDARDGIVRAWVDWDPAPALAAARARDATPHTGPLHGVPVGIKDIIDTAALPTQHGSPIFTGHHPDADAACVTALLSAGATVLGKTVTTEFAAYEPSVDDEPARSRPHARAAPRPARRPRWPTAWSRSPSARRRPGRWSAPPRSAGSSASRPPTGAPTVGASARRRRASTRSAGSRATRTTWRWRSRCWPPAEDGTRPPPERPRVAVVRTGHWDEADDDTRAAIETAAARLADDGVDVEELDPPTPSPGSPRRSPPSRPSRPPRRSARCATSTRTTSPRACAACSTPARRSRPRPTSRRSRSARTPAAGPASCSPLGRRC